MFITTRRPSRLGRRLFQEYKLIAAQTHAPALKFRERETVGPVEINNLFGLGDLVGVAAYPINDVAPAAHASFGPRLDPRSNVFTNPKRQQSSQGRLCLVRRHYYQCKREPENHR